jgi:hypothetical protein
MPRPKPLGKQDEAAAIAAFIQAKGVTRCPTACIAPTQSVPSGPDRTALRSHADSIQERRRVKFRTWF